MKMIAINKHKFNVALNNKMLFVATLPAKYPLPKKVKGVTVTGRKVVTASFAELEKALVPVVRDFEKALVAAEKAKAKTKVQAKTKKTTKAPAKAKIEKKTKKVKPVKETKKVKKQKEMPVEEVKTKKSKKSKKAKKSE